MSMVILVSKKNVVVLYYIILYYIILYYIILYYINKYNIKLYLLDYVTLYSLEGRVCVNNLLKFCCTPKKEEGTFHPSC
jgi:hypothetical protein